MTKTYHQFAAEHDGKFLWDCDAGANEDDLQTLDVLVYDSEEDLDADDDNSLAIARATVVDDREDAIQAVFAEIGSEANGDWDHHTAAKARALTKAMGLVWEFRDWAHAHHLALRQIGAL